MHYLLKCRSLTYAQRGVRVLERAGITGTLTRLPKSVSDRGCGYSIIVAPRNLDRALEVLSRNGMKPERLYTRDETGTIREAGHDLS